MNTARRPLSWLDLAPWHDQENHYVPEGCLPEAGQYELFEVDGVEYVSDRHMVVRRDLLEGTPSSWQYPFIDATDPAQLRELLAPSGQPGTTWLAPFYLDLAERLGVTPTSDGTRWFLSDDEGRVLAVINGYTPDDRARQLVPPMLPGYDLARARVVAERLDYNLGARTRWWHAVEICAGRADGANGSGMLSA